MLVSALLIGFIILGLFMSMLSSRPESGPETAVPDLPHPVEIPTLPVPELSKSEASDLVLSQG
jgi:hypothetical protein